MFSWKGKMEATRSLRPRSLQSATKKDPGSLFLVDTRQEWEYRTGHLKGAVEFSHGTDRLGKMAQGIGA